MRSLRPWALFVFVGLLIVACGRTGLRNGPQPSSGSAAGGDGGGGSGPGPGPGGSGGSGASGAEGGSGGQEPCMVDAECQDDDPCTTDRCDMGSCFHTQRDDDDDGFVALACGGPDCNDLNPNAHPGLPEVCADGSDNDCNGVLDCFDPVCEDVPNCACQPESEICDNLDDEDCDGTVDCNDPDCIGTPACGCGVVDICGNGIDDDCDGPLDCDDSDCVADQICQCMGSFEFCTNDADDDCDLLVDCADPDCAGDFACSCIPPGSPEVCNDDFDNDCDMLVDCADPACVGSPSCSQCTAEICDNALDDDCDGMIDCADAACLFSPACPIGPEQCNNGLDDDLDGLTDCDDPDCANNPQCVLDQANCLTAKLIPPVSGTYTGDTTGSIGHEMGSCGGGAGEAVFKLVLGDPSFVLLDSKFTTFDSVLYVRHGDCESGAEIACDDDSANFQWAAQIEFPILYPGTYFIFLDGFTIDSQGGANEGPFTFNVQIIPNPPEICAGGVDDDGDHHVDCADSDCSMIGFCATCNQGGPGAPELGIAACTDGIDDDCDGLPDCTDPDCKASPYAVTECCDGDDDNDNMIPDDFACGCASDLDCDLGYVCYDHTIWSCGLPCNQFFGEVCPAVALGSFCSDATLQCEF
jgi:putative metal-binding protein